MSSVASNKITEQGMPVEPVRRAGSGRRAVCLRFLGDPAAYHVEWEWAHGEWPYPESGWVDATIGVTGQGQRVRVDARKAYRMDVLS